MAETFDLGDFLTKALLAGLENGSIVPELVSVYAGNYLAKSMITSDEMSEIATAVKAYQAVEASKASSN
ncbi:hypothetical protein [Liquorilactobacillus ghanensis]|uniref:hypothetical protein n=1 Tax=Liquorilactobacillus ghanensis TaxID=399370 RepID=UPI0039E8E1BD